VAIRVAWGGIELAPKFGVLDDGGTVAISFGVSGNANSASLDPETQSVTLGTIVDGDLIMVVFETNVVVTAGLAFNYDGGTAASKGWTVAMSTVYGSTANTVAVLTKAGVAADTGKIFNAVWTTPTTARSVLVYATWHGVDSVNVINRSAENGSGATVHTTPTATSTDAGWVVNVLGYRHTSFTGWTSGGSYTNRVTFVQSGSGTNCVGIFDSNTNVAAGTVGGGTYTSNVSTASGTMWTFALKPSAPLPGTVAYTWYTSTDTTADVRGKTVAGTAVRVKVSGGDFGSPVFFGPDTPDADGRVQFSVTGLTPGVEYDYQLADTPSGGSESLIGNVGRLVAQPDDGVIRIAPWGCITTNAADSTAMDDLTAWAPHLAPCLGDFSYFSPTSTSASVHAAGIESQIAGAAGLKTLLRDSPVPYLVSDHDTVNADNGDSNTSVNQASIEAYQQYAPNYGLVASGTGATKKGRWQSTVIPSPSGGVRLIFADSRSMDRSPGLNTDGASKTHFGAEQLAWLLDELDAAEPLKVLFMDVGWMGPASTANGEDKMWSYAYERQVIIDHIAADPTIRVELVHSDSHLIGTTARESNAYGNFPVTCTAPMHNVGGGRNPNEFDWFFSNSVGDCRQYIRMTITDDAGAGTITVEKVGWDAVTASSKGSETTVWDLATTGTIAAVQANQTATAVGVTGVNGTVAVTQADQTGAAVGVLAYTGTISTAQADQTSTATGALAYDGQIAATQADQTATAAGAIGNTGTVAATQADNTAQAEGTFEGVDLFDGIIAATQADQVAAAAGQVGYVGTIASAQADQTAAAVGVLVVVGAVHATQDEQTGTAVGLSYTRVTARPNTGTTVRPNAGVTPRL
jgi:hypothetical protein